MDDICENILSDHGYVEKLHVGDSHTLVCYKTAHAYSDVTSYRSWEAISCL